MLRFNYVYWARHDYRHWYQFGWVPVTMYAMNLPGFLAGRSLLTPLTIYAGQTSDYKELALNIANFPKFLQLAFPTAVLDHYELLKRGLMVLTCLILLAGFWYLRRLDLTPQRFLVVATWSFWTCTMFLPSMHDRYSYFVMVMLALVALLDRRMIGVALVSIGISTVLYLRYLLNADTAIDLCRWRSSKSSTTVALRRAPSCTRSRSICTVLDKKTTPTLSTRKVGALLFLMLNGKPVK
ncbi:hypothetical protein [Limosilactobacillus fermentum]|uniref:hypothetical protein n=1 Tax=Limosilactobacillus fermentum TaxID=1613 RepID=UPI0021A7FDB6|nr:hypothetical protein [Limosilactobacillus fermentum]